MTCESFDCTQSRVNVFDVTEFTRQLHARVPGQHHFITDLAETLQIYLGRTKPRHGPRARFLIFGPAGTGKTELSKIIAQLVFPQHGLVRIAMDLPMPSLFGIPRVYVGASRGLFARELLQTPNRLVLFDGAQKAPAKTLDSLTGIFDGSGTTDLYDDEKVDFSHSIVIMECTLNPDTLLELLKDAKSPEVMQRRMWRCFEYAYPSHPDLFNPHVFDRIYAVAPGSPASR